MIPAIANYAIYLIVSGALLGLFFVIYTKVTPFDEMALIHAGKGAAALSLGGAMIGFSLTLASSIVHYAGIVQVLMWAVAAMIVQVLVFVVASRLMHTVRTEIEANNVAMGGFVGTVSLVAGIVNAACLS